MFFCPFIRQCPYNLNQYTNNQAPGQIPDQNTRQCSESNQYIVKKRDTFYKISKFYNVSPDDLLELNPELDPDKLCAGQVIRIPISVPASTCPPNANTYIVQKGDTFYKIAKKFKLPIGALMKANPKVNPDAIMVGLSICIPKLFNEYTNAAYNIALMYPLRWVKDNDERYEGIDGFFQISAISTLNNAEQICEEEAHHRLKPYGSKPTITNTLINNQEACYIYPSADQPMEMREQAALVVKYPQPIVVSARTYNYLILWADKSHIKGISSTLKYITV